MKRFEGRTVLVAGASAGIGRAVAVRLATEGATVVGVARNGTRLEEALAVLEGGRHRAIVADVSDPSSLAAVLASGKELGGFAGAVVAAGIHETRPLSLVNPASIQKSIDANVVSAVNVMQVVLKARRPEGAAIVCLSSVAALRATPGFLSYSAGKAALIASCRVAAAELASRKIRVNAILAGVVETEMSQSWMSRLDEAQREAVVRAHLLGIGSPDDIAGVAAFLLSDDARWMTGSMVVVDGGLSIR